MAPLPPGGPPPAPYSGAAGAALAAMVARLTLGKKKYAEVEAQMYTLLERAEALRKALTETIERDAAAFAEVIKAFKLPKETPEQQAARAQAVEEATLHAAQVPLETARMAVEVIELAVQAVELGNLNAISDGATGAALARAALTGAGYNVRINVTGLQDQTTAQALIDEVRTLEARANEQEAKIKHALVVRGGMPAL